MTKEMFKPAPKLERKWISARVVLSRQRDLIQIDDRGLRLVVKDARALRDWLNKVLP